LLIAIIILLYYFSGKLEADNAPLSNVYHYFGMMYNHYSNNEEIQNNVLIRWKFISTSCTTLSFILTPKFAAEGFYVDNDKIDVFKFVNKFASSTHPDIGEKAEEELAFYVSSMISLQGAHKETIFKLNSNNY
jgi:hypothetical protein